MRIYSLLLNRLKEPRTFMQVLLGPRQVGKTTLALQMAKEIQKSCHYVSPDLATLQNVSWLEQQWEAARKKSDPKIGALLIIDEIQKSPIGRIWSSPYGMKIHTGPQIYLSFFSV